MRLRGGRTGVRAVMVEQLELTGLMRPFDTEIWFGDRVGVLLGLRIRDFVGRHRLDQPGRAFQFAAPAQRQRRGVAVDPDAPDRHGPAARQRDEFGRGRCRQAHGGRAHGEDSE